MNAVAPNSLANAARAMLPWLVERRRHLHRNPELSYQEKNTAAFVKRELRALGIERIVTGLNGNHSLCAEIPGREAGRFVGLRADMDALPIQEETEWADRSQTPNVSHMCGHDAHTTMLLGAARLLWERRESLPWSVRLFFQGGEEKFPGGALDFIKTGKLEGVRSLFGLHVSPMHDTGLFGYRSGPMMAGVDEVTIVVKGIAGHAAYPHTTRDPVLAAAHVLVALQQIVSRRTDPFEPAVLSMTQLRAGSAFNIIPGEVWMNGTVRSFRPDMHAHFSGMIREIASQTAAAFGCTVEIKQEEGYPPVLNEAAATEHLRAAASRVLGETAVIEAPKSMGAEDFSLYTREIPASFGWLGAARPDDNERYMLHHPKFHLDEDCLWRGAAVLAEAAAEPLGR